MLEHGHSDDEIRARIGQPIGTEHLKDFVYGGIDGAVTTFAIVAGVHGASLSHSVIIALGIANVLADGFSMAASNYSGTKAELDDVERIRAIERRHIREVPDGERAEIRQILQLKGFGGQTLERAVSYITRDEKTWINMMLVDEYGKSPIDPRPLPAALVTFIAFLICGFIPLVPFLFEVTKPFEVAAVATAIAFFSIGVLKSAWSLQPWWRSGLETLAIGASAAFIAYGAGYLVSELVG